MRGRRVWLGMVALCCLAALVAGCVDLSMLAPKEPVTIRFSTYGSVSDYEPFVEEFQKTHKHVTIEVRTLNFQAPPSLGDTDILLTVPFMLPDLIEEGFAMSLNTLLQEDSDFDLNDFYPGAVDAFRTQGTIWGLPFMADAMMMFYNRDLFDKHGVDYPEPDWTWDEFLDRARQLSHPDLGEYGFAYQQMGTNETTLLMYQFGGRLVDDLSNPTRVTFNDPNNVVAMQWYADLIHRHFVSPPAGQRSQPYPQRGIDGGKYAMWTGSYSAEWPDLNVGRATIPRADHALTLGTVLGFVISAETQDPQACWDWVTYLAETASPGLIPANRTLAESGAFAAGMPEVEMQAVALSMDRLMSLNINFQGQLRSHWGATGQAYMQALVAIQNGDPVQLALDQAQQRSGF